MKVFFLQAVPKIARKGEIKEVSDGYYRNFLLPKKLATIATGTIVDSAKAAQKREQRSKEHELMDMKKVAQKLNGASVVIVSKASPEGTLFGGVSAEAIAHALSKVGPTVDIKWVQLSHTIKKVGIVTVALHLPHGMKAEVKVEVKAE